MAYLRKAKLKDLNYVCENMREIDRIEAIYQTGENPEDALRLIYLHGEEMLTIASEEDQPMGLCGVVSDGCIWMLATDELFSSKRDRLHLIRKGRKWVDELFKN